MLLNNAILSILCAQYLIIRTILLNNLLFHRTIHFNPPTFTIYFVIFRLFCQNYITCLILLRKRRNNLLFFHYSFKIIDLFSKYLNYSCIYFLFLRNYLVLLRNTRQFAGSQSKIATNWLFFSPNSQIYRYSYAK